ncbi:MAG: hypothetical protein R2827_03550 [Bdellovibrionales bacterium]
MKVKFIHILFVIFLPTQVFGGDPSEWSVLHQTEQQMISLRKNLEGRINTLVEESAENVQYVLTPYHHELVSGAVVEYFSLANLLYTSSGLDSFSYDRKQALEYFASLSARLAYFSELADTFLYLFQSPALIRMIESDIEPEDSRKLIHQMLSDVFRQLRSEYDDYSLAPINNSRLFKAPTAGTVAHHVDRFNSRIKRLEKAEHRQQVAAALNNYLNSFLDKANELQERAFKDYKSGPLSDFFYFVRSKILYATGKVYVPRSFFIDESEIEIIENGLEPGDIAIIRHYKKLTNVAFRGEWSHSVLYLGSFEKLSSYFDSDPATAQFFQGLCSFEGLACSNYSEYLILKYPEALVDYTTSDNWKGEEVPKVAIEGLGEGIIFTNLYQSLMKDQWVVFRPKMEKIFKAFALLEAFTHWGKPYDYMFDMRTDSRLVCTELIYQAYTPNEHQGRPGIEFHQSFVNKKPVMYAEDIIRTYFDYEDDDTKSQMLELVVYVRPSRDSGILNYLGSRALRETLD